MISWAGEITNRWRGLKSFSFYLVEVHALIVRPIRRYLIIVMSDPQILKWFFGACTVILLLQKIGFVTERLAKKAQLAPQELPEFMICDTPVGVQSRKEEISEIVSQYLGVRIDRLKPDLCFVDDLRVPPGELELLLERIEGHFGIMIHRKNTLTFGDLLVLVKVRQPQN